MNFSKEEAFREIKEVFDKVEAEYERVKQKHKTFIDLYNELPEPTFHDTTIKILMRELSCYEIHDIWIKTLAYHPRLQILPVGVVDELAWDLFCLYVNEVLPDEKETLLKKTADFSPKTLKEQYEDLIVILEKQIKLDKEESLNNYAEYTVLLRNNNIVN